MTAIRPQKRSAADSRNPLEQTGILQRVLDYVGPGHWLFVTEVNFLWRLMYKKVASREVQVNNPFVRGRITCIPQMTTFTAVFASSSRVRLAHARELRYRTAVCHHSAGMYGDVATLEAAHELGMQYTQAAMDGAARCNQLAVMQFLRAQGCPWGLRTFNLAAKRGNIDMCAYLFAEQCPWVKVLVRKPPSTVMSAHCAGCKSMGALGML
jgi:hypothetical protein